MRYFQYTLDQNDNDSPPPPPPSTPAPLSAYRIYPGYNYFSSNGQGMAVIYTQKPNAISPQSLGKSYFSNMVFKML